jgi:hypothetical protein
MKEGITIYDSLYIAFAEKEGFNFGHIHMLGEVNMPGLKL